MPPTLKKWGAYWFRLVRSSVRLSVRPVIQLLKNKDIENLEKFQRKCLKQIQGLPDNTSNTACLALLGILPVEALLHKNLLNMFVNMMEVSRDTGPYP